MNALQFTTTLACGRHVILTVQSATPLESGDTSALAEPSLGDALEALGNLRAGDFSFQSVHHTPATVPVTR